MGSSPSKKYGAAEAPVQPPPKANKKYTAKKAIRVSSARLGAAVYEELYEDADPAEVLGRGRLGDVALARGRGERAGDAFAVRTLTTTNSSIEDMRRQMVVFEKLQREIHCDWLVPIASCCLGRGDEPRARVVFKRCAGEFLEVLSSEPHRSTFTEAAARDVVRKLATVLRQCHEAGFAHRQVRAEHVLAAERGGGPPSPRLGGWGLAAPTDPEADDANVPDALNLAADLVYCAPELAGGCGRDDHDARRLRTHGGLDVWALGVFFHVLLFGKGPLFDVDDARCEDRAGVERRLAEAARRGGSLFSENVAGPIADLVSDEGKRLLADMLIVDPDYRPTCAALLATPYLKGETRLPAETLSTAHVAAFVKRRRKKAAAAPRVVQVKARDQETKEEAP